MDEHALDPSSDQQDEKLRYDGAAMLTGIKVATLQAMVCRKKIPHYRLGKRLVVFSKSELMDWMSERWVASK